MPLLINLLQDTEIEGIGFSKFKIPCALIVVNISFTKKGVLKNSKKVCQYSARALTYLLESLPRSSHAVAEAIPALLSRVANIHDDALIMVLFIKVILLWPFYFQ